MVNRLPYVHAGYLKGSFAKIYFVPVMSDLDFFLIGDVSSENLKKLGKYFKVLNFFFPIISDYDFHTKEDADILMNLGDLKFANSHNWKAIKGQPLKFQYRYHPRKFYFDIVNEIYFQLEWLFKNLKERKKGQEFQSLKIQRQFEKIKDILNYLHTHPTYEIERREFRPNYRWTTFTNEEIILKFNSLIERNLNIKKLSRIILVEFYDRDIEKILNLEYYQKNLTLIDMDFEYQGKHHYLSKNLFRLFYFTGCIDSYLIFDWINEHSRDRLASAYLMGQYYSKLIERRFNSQHGESFLRNKKQDVMNTLSIIQNRFPLVESPQRNLMGKNLVIVACDNKKETSFEPLVWINRFKDQPDTNILIVCQDYDRNIKNEAILNLYGFQIDENCDYHAALFSVGVSWTFGARNVLLVDGKVDLSDSFVDRALSDEYNYLEFGLVSDYSELDQPFILSSSAGNLRYIDFTRLSSWNCLQNEILHWIILGEQQSNQYYQRINTCSQIRVHHH